jgi:phospholipase/carboxylesterase
MDIKHFHHQFVNGRNLASSPTLLLLHGTGGTEDDLLPLGKGVAPEYNLLSPRGKVSENGMNRFFRRFAEGVFDVEDIKLRARELADWVAVAAQEYGFDAKKVIGLGYSNGANIAGALLLLHPEVLAHALLMHPMVPLVPEKNPDLKDKKILITAGKQDHISPPNETQRLDYLLQGYGAAVELFWHPYGHQLINEEAIEAQKFLAKI